MRLPEPNHYHLTIEILAELAEVNPTTQAIYKRDVKARATWEHYRLQIKAILHQHLNRDQASAWQRSSAWSSEFTKAANALQLDEQREDWHLVTAASLAVQSPDLS